MLDRNRVTVAAFIMACAAGGLLGGGTARADVFYGVTNSGSNSQLLRFDMGAQTVTSVGAIPSLFEDCDFDASGTLWGIRNGSIGFPPTVVMQSYTINTSTAAATLQTNFGNNVSLASMAFQTGNITPFSVDTAGATTAGKLVFTALSLGQISPVTGNPDGLVPQRVDALAFSPSGALYGIWNSNSSPFGSNSYKLVSFSLVNGVATVIGPIISGTDSFNSLRFDSSGNAYTVDAVTGGVYTINLTTGAGTLAFNGGSLAINTSGLALVVPAPGAAVLLGLGALRSMRRRR